MEIRHEIVLTFLSVGWDGAWVLVDASVRVFMHASLVASLEAAGSGVTAHNTRTDPYDSTNSTPQVPWSARSADTVRHVPTPDMYSVARIAKPCH